MDFHQGLLGRLNYSDYGVVIILITKIDFRAFSYSFQGRSRPGRQLCNRFTDLRRTSREFLLTRIRITSFQLDLTRFYAAKLL
jgi:hypothetical protein